MSEKVVAKNQQTKVKTMNSTKNFSKLWVLQCLGLLSKKYNPETSEFESSLSLRLVFYLSLFSKLLFALKLVVCYAFPKDHKYELFIGSPYNYIPDTARFFIAIVGSIAFFWCLSFHWVFNHINSKKNYRLYKFWMKLTMELPVKNDRCYIVAGLAQKDNKKFWLHEKYFNYVCYRVLNGYFALISLVLCMQLFFVRFEGVEIYSATYILVQTFHIVHTIHTCYALFHCYFTLNLFHMWAMRFFSKRFHSIGKRVESMRELEMSRMIENWRLSRLVYAYNRTHHDLILINDFYKSYVGFNLIFFFSLGVNGVFIILMDLDLRLVNFITH